MTEEIEMTKYVLDRYSIQFLIKKNENSSKILSEFQKLKD